MQYLQETPYDLRILFNPPYCGLVIVSFIEHYTSKTKKEFPPSLLFLILPLTLNKQYLELFSKNPKQNLYQIVEKNSEKFFKIPNIIENYIEITNETIFFLTESNVLSFIDEKIIINKKNIKITSSINHVDLKGIKSVSNTLAKINDIPSIFLTLGVKL